MADTVDLTLAQLYALRQKYLDALAAVTSGLSYSMGTVSNSRVTPETCRLMIDKLTREIRDRRAMAAAGSDDFARSQPGVAVARIR